MHHICQKQYTHKQPGGKPKNNKLDTDQFYQGRKIVSNIQHLYKVVDDKKAYAYYDKLLSDVTSTTGTSASSVAGIKEEEMVDRMLSQFPVSASFYYSFWKD